MYLYLGHNWGIAAILTVVFAGLARWLRGVTWSGAIAGAAICFLLYTGGGPGAFAALITVFVLAWSTTKVGYQRKQKLGTAEKKEGRTAAQVCANLSVAAICCATHFRYPQNSVLLLAAASALAEAAADTVSSEIGQISGKARLITTGEAVSAGIDGGVSLTGTIAGTIAAALVATVSVITHLISWNWFGLCLAAAIVGMFADSLLGAAFERRGWLNNNTVNFFGTLIAAIAGSLFCYI